MKLQIRWSLILKTLLIIAAVIAISFIFLRGYGNKNVGDNNNNDNTPTETTQPENKPQNPK